MAQRARVDQLVRVDAGNGAAGDVPHVVHAALQQQQPAPDGGGGGEGG